MDISPPIIDAAERKFLYYLSEGLLSGAITRQQAQEHVQKFLSLLPFTDEEDFNRKIQEVSLWHSQYGMLYPFILAEEYEEEKKYTLNQMREHLKSGDIEKALAVVQAKTT